MNSQNSYNDRQELYNEKDKLIFKQSLGNDGNLLGTQFIYDSENKYFKKITYIDKSGYGAMYYYNKNELLSKIEVKVDGENIIKHGKTEKYIKGVPVLIGGYENGKKHGKWAELDLKTNKIKVAEYEKGHKLNIDHDIKQSLQELAQETANIFFERNPEIALRKLIAELIKKEPKTSKVPNIRINFEDEKLQEGIDKLGYTSFFEDGSPKVISEMARLDKSGEIILKGNYLEHYDDCQIKAIGQHDSKGDKMGEWQYFNDDGTLYKKKTYKNSDLSKLSNEEIKEELSKDGILYRNLNEQQKKNEEFLEIALKNEPLTLEYVPEDMLDKKIVKETISKNKKIKPFIPQNKLKTEKRTKKRKAFDNIKIIKENENGREREKK